MSKKIVVAVIVGMMAGAVLVLGLRNNPDGDYGPAADFALNTISGELRSLSNYGVGSTDKLGNGYLLVNFWASWCQPCVKEIPLLTEFYEKHHQVITVLGIAADRIEPAQRFSEQMQISYPVLFGEYELIGQLMQDYGNSQEALPFTVLIDPSGQIVWRHLGLLRAEDLQGLSRQVTASR